MRYLAATELLSKAEYIHSSSSSSTVRRKGCDWVVIELFVYCFILRPVSQLFIMDSPSTVGKKNQLAEIRNQSTKTTSPRLMPPF